MEEGSLLSLNAEALDLVLRRLSVGDIGRLGVTCKDMLNRTRNGHHAAQLWALHCQDLLGHALVDYVATAGQPAGQAPTWHRLYCSARCLDTVHWSQGVNSAESVTCVSYTSSSAHGRAGGAAKLARFGHTATVAGDLLILVGGLMRDGPSSVIDVSVVDVAHRRIIQPRMHGVQPPALRHMCTALVTMEQGSMLHSQVLEAVQAAQQPASSDQQAAANTSNASRSSSDAASSGHTLLVFGGLTPDGSDVGGQQLFVLWLAPDASWGVWLATTTSGLAPEPRAFACSEAVCSGRTMIVYGGWANGSMEGTINADVGVFDGHLLLCVYLLDVNTLTWRRQPTRPLSEPPRPGHTMLGPSTCPGPRKQAMSCVRVSPVTGNEEFLVLGGCGSDGLASFVPYVLDLQTYIWTKGPVMGFLPEARDAASLMKVSNEWLLLLGGKGARGEPLTDVHRLHLPSLSWRPPPHVYNSSCSSGTSSSNGSSHVDGSRGAGAVRQPGNDTVDFTATAGVVVGGSREGPYGVVIVPRLEVLLPGPPIAFDAQGRDDAGRAASRGFFEQRQLLTESEVPALLLQQQQQQQLDFRMGAATCHCGSCCSCLALKAAAAGGCGSCMHLPIKPQGPHTAGHGMDVSVSLAVQGRPAAGIISQNGAVTLLNGASPPSAAATAAADLSRGGKSSPGLRKLTSTVSEQQLLRCQQQQQLKCEMEIVPDAFQPPPIRQGVLGLPPESAAGPATASTAAARKGIGVWEAGTAHMGNGWAATVGLGGNGLHDTQWHLSHKGGLQGRPLLLQVLAAAGVLLLGLLLAYPSMMLHNAIDEFSA